MANNKKRSSDAMFIAAAVLGTIVIVVLLCFVDDSLLKAPKMTEPMEDGTPAFTDFNVDNFRQEESVSTELVDSYPTAKPTVKPTEEPVKSDAAVSAPETIVEPNQIDLSPNDEMIYQAMDSSRYKELVENINAEPRVGITDIREDNEKGIVIEYCIENTDAVFEQEQLNNYNTFTPLRNKYGDEYPIVYFTCGEPVNKNLFYGAIGNSYENQYLICTELSTVVAVLYDVQANSDITIYLN